MFEGDVEVKQRSISIGNGFVGLTIWYQDKGRYQDYVKQRILILFNILFQLIYRFGMIIRDFVIDFIISE